MKTKVKIILSTMAISAMVITTACTGQSKKEGTETRQETEMQQEKSEMKQYTCPMHPEVVQNQPGDCPKCGMTLVEKKSEMDPSHEGHMHH